MKLTMPERKAVVCQMTVRYRRAGKKEKVACSTSWWP